ncbi:MAG: AAA family ATPase [Verrucomicrobiales bacterium]
MQPSEQPPDFLFRSRLETYESSLSAGATTTRFLSWLRREQYAALQNGKPTPVFSAAVEAMKRCLLHAEHIEYNVQEEDVLARFADGEWRRFSEMSAGQRTMLALVADIAYRAAWLNPHLGTSVLDETPGVVLIDELDLHLHPKWQRRVCDDLRRTFPKVQFIAASHSPFIIQSLQPNELISLDDGEVAIEYANRGVEEIARFIQGVKMPHTSERYARQKEAAKRYFGLLREGRGNGDAELRAAKADLDALTAHFADNPAADAFLELKRGSRRLQA